jgi:cell surface protein SprA
MEPQGLIDTKEKRDSIWHSFGEGGRMNFFDQRFDLTYQIPINKIPMFSWITSNFRYAGQYKFMGAPVSTAHLGNTIDNSNQIQFTGQVNMQTLYNYIPYLKKVNSPPQQLTKKPDPSKSATEPSKGKKSKSENDSLKTVPNYGKIIGDGTLRFLMMVRNVNLSWSQGKGTILPGFTPAPDLFGINFSKNAPGFLFVFGGQPDIIAMASKGGWITKNDTLLNAAYQKRMNQSINFRAQLEPFKDFRIDVMAKRDYTDNETSYLRADDKGILKPVSTTSNGNFSISYVALGTMFKKSDDLFNNFKAIRLNIAKRLADENPNSVGKDSAGYRKGYGALSQDVLLYSFMAAYMGKNPDKMKVNKPFITVPLPNWQLRYNGLTKIKVMANVFQNFTINHNYSCTYSIGNFRSNVFYKDEVTGYPEAIDPLGNFISQNEISQISLKEDFSPLIGFDMTLTNSLLINVQYKMGRTVSLSFANNQITEMISNDLTISAGYRFKDLKLGITIGGSKRQVVSDLNIALGFSMHDNTTTLRKIGEDVTQISAGMLNFSINATADYQVSALIGLQLYYKHLLNKPYISTQYQNGNIEAGISVRLSLTQ